MNALNLERIQEAYQTALTTPSPWNVVRTEYWHRLQVLGLPRARSDSFFWVPQSLIQSIDPMPVEDFKPVACELSTASAWLGKAGQETDLAAIFPVLLSSGPVVQHCAEASEWQELYLSGSASYEHHVVHVAMHSKVRVYWEQTPNHSFSSQRLDLVLGEGAQVEFIESMSPHSSRTLWRHLNVQQQGQSQFHYFGLDAGSRLYRLNAEIHLHGRGASCAFHALSLLDASAHSHRRIAAFHEAPECQSNQFIRHVLDGQSHASCDSSVEICKGVPGSKAHQLVNSLLLGNACKASAKPTLLIHNDEVEASHGTTCGDLDRSQLFYLQSRGLSATQARRVLLDAFTNEVLAGSKLSMQALAILQQRFV